MTSKADARVTLNLRLVLVRRDGNALVASFAEDDGRRIVEKQADHIVTEHGALALDEFSVALKPLSSNRGAIDPTVLLAGRPVIRDGAAPFGLYRIGDVVAGRNIHAAAYDAPRL
jgi:hypothetical protein